MRNLGFALICLCLFLSTSTAGDYCGNFPEDRDYRGTYKIPRNYRNFTYGFSLTVPKGYVGHGEQIGTPHHGFGIVLSWEPRAYIYVGADYNSVDYESLVDIKDDHLKRSKEAADQVISVEESTTALATLPAARFVVRHTCPKLKGVYVDDETVVWSKEREIIYQAYLLTTETRYERDKAVLQKLLSTWKLSPIE